MGDYGFYTTNYNVVEYGEGMIHHNFFSTVTLRGHLHLYSFRFFNDNGSESASTAYSANITEAANILPGHKLRLRIGINTRSNAKSITPRLMFRVRKLDGTLTPWATVEK